MDLSEEASAEASVAFPRGLLTLQGGGKVLKGAFSPYGNTAIERSFSVPAKVPPNFVVTVDGRFFSESLIGDKNRLLLSAAGVKIETDEDIDSFVPAVVS